MSEIETRSATEGAADGAPEGGMRLAGLDLARGLAYLGMIAVNFHLVLTWGRPRASLEPAVLEAAVESLFGRAAATFVLVAGVGLSLRVRRPQRPGPTGFGLVLARSAFLLLGLVAVLGASFNAGRAERLGTAAVGGLDRPADWGALLADLGRFTTAAPAGAARTVMLGGLIALSLLAVAFVARPRLFAGRRGSIFLRALVLLGLGYLWQPVWSGDILHFYGLWLLLALPLLRAPGWLLALLVLVIPVGACGLHLVWDYGEHWTATLEHDGFWTAAGQLRDLVFDGWHPLLPWFGFLLAGLLLGRCRLEDRRAPVLAFLIGIVLVGAAAPLSRLATRTAAEAVELGGDFAPAAATVPAEEPPGRPLFARRGLALAIPDAIVDPAVRAGGRFLARRLRDERIADCALALREGAGEFVVRLAPGGDREDLEAVATGIKRWLLGLEGAERPAWPAALRFVRIEVDDARGDRHALLIDARAPGRLPYEEEIRILFGLGALPPGPFFFLHALGAALALLGFSFLLARIRPLAKLLAPFVATGRMAFTLYLGHVLVGMGLLDALKLLGGQGLPFALAVIAVACALSLAFASAWLALFRRGPLEALVRFLAP